MNIQKFDNVEEWLEARKGKVTGTKLKDIITKRGNTTKVGVYQLIADHLAVEDNENPMERGHRLEEEAIDMLAVTTGLNFIKDLCIISREDNPSMAWSPDGYTKDLKAGAEIKCLRSALHLQAIIEKKIPSDYYEQTIQPFIVCDTLEVLYFVFYDPRIVSYPFFMIEVRREDIIDDIEEFKDIEKTTLALVKAWVEKLSW